MYEIGIRLTEVTTCFLLTNMCGHIFFAVFCLLQPLLKKYKLFALGLRLLKIVLLMFFIPALYLLYFLNGTAYDFHFTCVGISLGSPFIFRLIQIISIIWIFMSLRTALYYRKVLKKSREQLLANRPCTDADTKRLYKSLCLKHRLKAPALYESVDISSPVLYGLFRQKISIPKKNFTDEELTIVLLHELTHYRKRDNWFRYLTVGINCLYVINTHRNYLSRMFDEWSELACDDSVCRRFQIDPNVYFQVIRNVSKKKMDYRSFFESTLIESENFLKRREEMIKGKSLGLKKTVSVLLTGVFLLASFSTCLASGAGLMKAGTVLAEETTVQETEAEGVEEYDLTEEIETGAVDFDEVFEINPLARATNMPINWTVPANTLGRSGYFNKSVGSTVVLMAAITPQKSIKIGLVEPDGVRRYITTSTTVSHTFEIRKSGSHCIYVENSNNEIIYVTGVYVK